MPKDYKSFCMVAAHLYKNAHRYYSEVPEAMNNEMDSTQAQAPQGKEISATGDDESMCRSLNQRLLNARTLK